VLFVAVAVRPHPLNRPVHHQNHKRTVQRSVRVRWHTVRLMVTEYVVDRESGCVTYTDLTASGARARQGTIAVNTSEFPFGTKFIIPGYGHGVAADTGSAVGRGHIDAAVVSTRTRSGCSVALNWGIRYLSVKYKE
jgi:3D (Asp-Asp-Asp) domain-containing protein